MKNKGNTICVFLNENGQCTNADHLLSTSSTTITDVLKSYQTCPYIGNEITQCTYHKVNK